MQKVKIFISSVQREFTSERRLLADYIRQDALFGMFFEPFIFEDLPAEDRSATDVYVNEVCISDIYIGILGQTYGNIDVNGKSPTEIEFDTATQNGVHRLIFVKDTPSRDEKEQIFIQKAERDLIRKKFSSYESLRSAVYTALIHYMGENGILRIFPFDATECHRATMNDIDINKVRRFISLAKTKRNFKLTLEEDGLETTLRSLNLITDNGKLTNAAILLFGTNPQHFFRTSEVKCAQFYGTEVQKPAPFYQIFEGTIFEMCDQAKAFVMSHIDAKIGDHSNADNQVEYELPESAVHEAIMNAIVHQVSCRQV